MALSQRAASYERRGFIKDQHLLAALDDLASQIDAVARQTKTSKKGVAQLPSSPSSLAVSAQNGFASVAITHNNPPAGALYVIEYSTTPGFQSPIRVDNGISRTWGQYLKGLRLYFRAAARFPASALTPWVYFGSKASPTPLSF